MKSENREKKIKTKIVCLFACILLVLLSSIMFSCNKDTTKNASTTKKIEITNTSMSTSYNKSLEYYSAKIIGVAKNVSGKNYSYVCIQYSVYDLKGNNLGTAFDSISNLSNGDTWEFEANLFYQTSRPYSYKLANVTYF